MIASISDRLDLVRQQIPENVRLVAVTKTVGLEAIRAAYAAGVRDFGENRVNEAIAKQEQLQDLSDVSWHFIGHLQTNKAKKALQHFDWIHSLDSLKLARRLNSLAAEMQIRPKICLQVKVMRDPNKYGWQVDELLADLAELDRCSSLNIQGLMTILPLGLSSQETLSAFQTTAGLAKKIDGLNFSNIAMNQLSMGMSADYSLAIAAGATMIRLGRIIFGERS
ncbi:MAG: YggS family pyridoxal phosphate-dependent enzyme [Prochloraceae cyanobacterium]